MAFSVAWRMDDGNPSSKRKNITVFNRTRNNDTLIRFCFSHQLLHLATKAFWHGVERDLEIFFI